MAEVTLDLLGQMMQRLTTEVASMRDDLTVMSAIVQRMDGTLSGMVNEIRATHAQQSRLANRVRALEAESRE